MTHDETTRADVTVERADPWPHDAPDTVRITARVGGRVVFSAMALPNDAHGDYGAWAAWNGADVPTGLQYAVECAVERLTNEEA